MDLVCRSPVKKFRYHAGGTARRHVRAEAPRPPYVVSQRMSASVIGKAPFDIVPIDLIGVDVRELGDVEQPTQVEFSIKTIVIVELCVRDAVYDAERWSWHRIADAMHVLTNGGTEHFFRCQKVAMRMGQHGVVQLDRNRQIGSAKLRVMVCSRMAVVAQLLDTFFSQRSNAIIEPRGRNQDIEIGYFPHRNIGIEIRTR